MTPTEAWCTTRMGEFVSLQRGYDLPLTTMRPGSVPVLGSAGVNGHHDVARAAGPGVVIGRSGASFGVAHFVARAYWPHNTVLFVTDFHGNDPRFVYYLLVKTDFSGLNSGSAQQSLNRNFVHAIPVSVPPVDVQRKIAAVLSAYDDLIENNLRRIRILEEMAQTIYSEWFVNFRFPGHEQVPMVDGLPEKWETVRLDAIYDTSSGGTPSRKQSSYFGGTIGWLKTKELNDSFIYDTEEKLTDEGLSNSSAKVFPADAVVVAMYGATIGKLGILGAPAATNQACCVLTQRSVEFGRAYAFLTLLAKRDDLIGLRAGAAQQNISQAVIKAFPVLRPSPQVVGAFGATVDPLLDLIGVLSRQTANLHATRDLLLPKLVSGELDVSELDIEVPEE
ncbi:MAG: restriction endonuclease subunit S [Armatimonadota bacterium]